MILLIGKWKIWNGKHWLLILKLDVVHWSIIHLCWNLMNDVTSNVSQDRALVHWELCGSLFWYQQFMIFIIHYGAFHHFHLRENTDPQERGSNVKQLASSDPVIVLHIKICFKTWFELSDTWIIVKAFCNPSSALLHFETSIDKISNGLYSATNICKIRMTWIHQKLYCI